MGTEYIYAYSSGGTMIPVGSGEDLTFDGVVTLKASGAEYQRPQNDDLKIVVTAYAVNTSASWDEVGDVRNDYEAGGNEEMIAGMGLIALPSIWQRLTQKISERLRMTYKLNPSLEKIQSPVVLILPDGGEEGISEWCGCV